MAQGNNPLPWERQPKETSQASEAFIEYRDMGRERSVRAVAQRLGKSATLISRWSSQHEWVKRAAAWDAEQDRKEREAAEAQRIKDIIAMRKRHADLANAMLIKAARALNRTKEEDIKPADISRMTEVAAKLERISRGDVETVIEERQGEAATPAVTFYIPENGRDQQNEEEE